MIWPGALVSVALFNTLHKNYGRKELKHISRETFFVIALTCSFVWYWVLFLLLSLSPRSRSLPLSLSPALTLSRP